MISCLSFRPSASPDSEAVAIVAPVDIKNFLRLGLSILAIFDVSGWY